MIFLPYTSSLSVFPCEVLLIIFALPQMITPLNFRQAESSGALRGLHRQEAKFRSVYINRYPYFLNHILSLIFLYCFRNTSEVTCLFPNFFIGAIIIIFIWIFHLYYYTEFENPLLNMYQIEPSRKIWKMWAMLALANIFYNISIWRSQTARKCLHFRAMVL